MNGFLKISLVLFSLLAQNIFINAQNQIAIPRLEGEIKFDGKVDDQPWQKLDALNNGDAYPNIR